MSERWHDFATGPAEMPARECWNNDAGPYPALIRDEIGPGELCLECGYQLAHQSGCVQCPLCGWSRCGF